MCFISSRANICLPKLVSECHPQLLYQSTRQYGTSPLYLTKAARPLWSLNDSSWPPMQQPSWSPAVFPFKQMSSPSPFHFIFSINDIFHSHLLTYLLDNFFVSFGYSYYSTLYFYVQSGFERPISWSARHSRNHVQVKNFPFKHKSIVLFFITSFIFPTATHSDCVYGSHTPQNGNSVYFKTHPYLEKR